MPKLWPRTLFGRNLLVLLALAAVAQGSTLTHFLLLKRPRLIEVAAEVAQQIKTLDVILSKVPAASRQDYIAQIGQHGRFVVQAEQPPRVAQPPQGALPAFFMQNLRADLPATIEVRWAESSPSRLWVHVDIAGERCWISLPVADVAMHYHWVTSGLILSLCMALLATIAALLIQRRINLPLREIAAAARKLGAGGRPERLPAYATVELAAVGEQFNSMVDGLDELEATRAIMLAGISHDIRTPLTKLRLSIAMDHPRGEPLLRRYLDQIDMIVGQFVDFAQLGSDEPSIEGDLNTLVWQLAAEFADRGHPFELALGRLPTLSFRPVAMMRVVNNLMENAVKYGLAGLEVRTCVEADQVTLAVLDRGPGLPPGEAGRLLQPFVRGDLGRSGSSGSGLGLAIVDRLMRLHGGQLRISQRQHGGVRAQISLPIHSPLASTSSPAAVTDPPLDRPSGLQA